MSASGKIFLLCAGDYNIRDTRIGSCIRAGVRTWQEIFSFHLPANRLVTYNEEFRDQNGGFTRPWNGSDLRILRNVQKQILGAINCCPVGPEDVLVFYWIGHGARDSRGHFLDLTPNAGPQRLYRTEILEAMHRRNPRLTVCITESCNVIRDDFFNRRRRIPTRLTLDPKRTTPLFRHLFFEKYGTLNINSSSPEQVALANNIDGGFFTGNLASLMAANAEKTLEWENLFDQIDEYAVEEEYEQRIYKIEMPKDFDESGDESEDESTPQNTEISVSAATVGCGPMGESGSNDEEEEEEEEEEDTGISGITDIINIINGINIINNTPLFSASDAINSGGAVNSVDAEGWSTSLHAPRPGDKILEVNGTKIKDDSLFRQTLREADDWVILKIADTNGEIWELKTRLNVHGFRRSCGIFVTSSPDGSVHVLDVMPGTPGSSCQRRKMSDK